MAAAETNPLHQFAIERIVPLHIGRFDISFTNSAAYMVAAVLLVTALVLLTTRHRRLVPDRWQSVTELSYEFIANMIEENAGHGSERYFPFIFSLFMFILLGNLLGMIPYTFTYHQPHHRDLRARRDRLHRRDDHRHRAARLPFPQALRAGRRAVLADADPGADRGHLLFHPPVHAVDPALRQHGRRATPCWRSSPASW